MRYRVAIERMDEAGIPAGPLQVFEAEDETAAIGIAVGEVDSADFGRPGVATISDASGHMLLIYTGRTET